MRENISMPRLADIFSAIMLMMITLYAVSRITFSPQFIDAYYHLQTATGLLRSGGWTGIDWWSTAPAQQPYVYPPLVHLMLMGLLKTGMKGIAAVRLLEVGITPLFFFILWLISRTQRSALFAFFVLLLAETFFPFMMSVAVHVPASFGICLCLAGWLAADRGKTVAAGCLLALALYAHCGVALMFAGGFALTAVRFPQMRQRYTRALALGGILFVPFAVHLLKNASVFRLAFSYQALFAQISIPLVLLVLAAAVWHAQRRRCEETADYQPLFFTGLLGAAAIVFFYYPYRLFSAQGALGAIFLGAYMLKRMMHTRIVKQYSGAVSAAVILMLFVAHSAVVFDNGVPRMALMHSSYWNIATGRSFDYPQFMSLYFPELYRPLLVAIQEHTQEDDIVGSNEPLVGQIFAALSGRPAALSLFKEVRHHADEHSVKAAAKIFLVARPEEPTAEQFPADTWQSVAGNDFASVLLHTEKTPRAQRTRAAVPAGIIMAFAAVVVAVIACDLAVPRRRRPGLD